MLSTTSTTFIFATAPNKELFLGKYVFHLPRFQATACFCEIDGLCHGDESKIDVEVSAYCLSECLTLGRESTLALKEATL